MKKNFIATVAFTNFCTVTSCSLFHSHSIQSRANLNILDKFLNLINFLQNKLVVPRLQKHPLFCDVRLYFDSISEHDEQPFPYDLLR